MAGRPTDLEPTPSRITEFNYVWITWLGRIFERISGPFKIPGYSVSNLPDATVSGDTSTFSSLIYIYDETGGPVVAFSDGTNWRRVTDRAIVS